MHHLLVQGMARMLREIPPEHDRITNQRFPTVATIPLAGHVMLTPHVIRVSHVSPQRPGGAQRYGTVARRPNLPFTDNQPDVCNWRDSNVSPDRQNAFDQFPPPANWPVLYQ